MLGTMRTRTGEPALRIRVLAALVAVGLLVGSAPVLVPVLRWLLGLLF